MKLVAQKFFNACTLPKQDQPGSTSSACLPPVCRLPCLSAMPIPCHPALHGFEGSECMGAEPGGGLSDLWVDDTVDTSINDALDQLCAG